MKTKRMYILAGIATLVLCMSIVTNTAQAVEVWSEDFNDELMTGWTTFAFESWEDGPIIAGNFSAEGGMLVSLDDDGNFARHDSTVNVGTWSFDLYVPDMVDGYVGVAFMSNGTRPFEFDTRMISIEATTVGIDRFIFWWIRGASNATATNAVAVTAYTPTESILGWHHIDVTRTSGGLFNIFFNGSFEYTTVTNDVTSSTYLECFASNATGAAFDNIVVSNTIDVTPPATTPTTPDPTPIPWDLIAIGGGVAVVVIVLVIVVIKRR